MALAATGLLLAVRGAHRLNATHCLRPGDQGPGPVVFCRYVGRSTTARVKKGWLYQLEKAVLSAMSWRGNMFGLVEAKALLSLWAQKWPAGVAALCRLFGIAFSTFLVCNLCGSMPKKKTCLNQGGEKGMLALLAHGSSLLVAFGP